MQIKYIALWNYVFSKIFLCVKCHANIEESVKNIYILKNNCKTIAVQLPFRLSNRRFSVSLKVNSFQLLSHDRLFVAPWTAACQASLSITNSRSLLKLMSIESEMPSNHLIFCHPLLLLPSIFPSLRVFSNESVLHSSWRGSRSGAGCGWLSRS